MHEGNPNGRTYGVLQNLQVTLQETEATLLGTEDLLRFTCRGGESLEKSRTWATAGWLTSRPKEPNLCSSQLYKVYQGLWRAEEDDDV